MDSETHMHRGAETTKIRVRCTAMSKRRPPRRSTRTLPHPRPTPDPAGSSAQVIVREASTVERLAYTRSQAAEALGLSRSTFIRRVLPYIDTIEMPWGAKLIPVDELERLLTERRRSQTAPGARTPGAPAARTSRNHRTDPLRARSRQEPAQDRRRPQRRPDPDGARGREVVALDGSLRPRPLEPANVRSNSAAEFGISGVITVAHQRVSVLH